jgi:hypothetical protein
MQAIEFLALCKYQSEYKDINELNICLEKQSEDRKTLMPIDNYGIRSKFGLN